MPRYKFHWNDMLVDALQVPSNPKTEPFCTQMENLLGAVKGTLWKDRVAIFVAGSSTSPIFVATGDWIIRVVQTGEYFRWDKASFPFFFTPDADDASFPMNMQSMTGALVLNVIRDIAHDTALRAPSPHLVTPAHLKRLRTLLTDWYALMTQEPIEVADPYPQVAHWCTGRKTMVPMPSLLCSACRTNAVNYIPVAGLSMPEPKSDRANEGRSSNLQSIAEHTMDQSGVSSPDQSETTPPTPYPLCACGHPWGMHTPTGCCQTYTSESTRGVIGLPTTRNCPCAAYTPSNQ